MAETYIYKGRAYDSRDGYVRALVEDWLDGEHSAPFTWDELLQKYNTVQLTTYMINSGQFLGYKIKRGEVAKAIDSIRDERGL